MLHYDPDLPIRVYLGETPVGVPSTLSKQHTIKDDRGMDIQVWKLVDYTIRTKTDTKKGYGKAEGESLGLLHSTLRTACVCMGQDLQW